MPTTIFADLRINTAPGYRDIEVFRSRLGRGFSQPLGRISGDAAEFSKSLQAAAARVSAFGAITGGLLAVNKVISATARATIEVNKQLIELNTYLGESQSNLDRFGKSLFTIARNTATNFADVAEAAKEFARQGLSTEETLKRTNDALVLSRVSGLNYAQSVNSITTALNGFNKEALSSSEIVNKLIAVDSRFAVSAAQLSEALTRVGSSAEESGLSFDELVATVTTAQQITGRGGAVIGNALKTIFTRVRRPEILEQLKQIGVTVTDQNGSLLNAIEILKNYADATRNLSQVEKARTAELLGGVYQINQLQAVIRDLSSANSIYASSLKIASTATDEARKKNEELNKSYSALLVRTGTLATQVGEQVGKDLFGPLITGGTSLANSLLGFLAPDKIGDIGSKAGESLANGFFDKFRETLKPATSTLLQTAGNLLLNVGGPLALGLSALLTARLGKFLITSFKTISKDITSPLNRYVSGGTLSGEAEQKKLALVNQIAAVLQKNSYVNNNITSSTYSEARARKEVLAQIRLQNLELQRQKTLSETIVRSVSSRTPPVFDLRDLPPARPRRRRAGGYIPAGLFDLAEQEVNEAKQFGAKNPKAKLVKATVKGRTQTIMANDQEDIIPNFAGTGETAFIPRYRRMQDIPSMSSGYIPNFALPSDAVLRHYYKKAKKASRNKYKNWSGYGFWDRMGEYNQNPMLLRGTRSPEIEELLRTGKFKSQWSEEGGKMSGTKATWMTGDFQTANFYSNRKSRSMFVQDDLDKDLQRGSPMILGLSQKLRNENNVFWKTNQGESSKNFGALNPLSDSDVRAVFKYQSGKRAPVPLSLKEIKQMAGVIPEELPQISSGYVPNFAGGGIKNLSALSFLFRTGSSFSSLIKPLDIAKLFIGKGDIESVFKPLIPLMRSPTSYIKSQQDLDNAKKILSTLYSNNILREKGADFLSKIVDEGSFSSKAIQLAEDNAVRENFGKKGRDTRGSFLKYRLFGGQKDFEDWVSLKKAQNEDILIDDQLKKNPDGTYRFVDINNGTIVRGTREEFAEIINSAAMAFSESNPDPIIRKLSERGDGGKFLGSSFKMGRFIGELGKNRRAIRYQDTWDVDLHQNERELLNKFFNKELSKDQVDQEITKQSLGESYGGNTDTLILRDLVSQISNPATLKGIVRIPKRARFSSGYIPNFASSKFVQNIVDSYKASLTEKDPIRFNAAQKQEKYYNNVNSELKNLSVSSGYSIEKLAYGLAALSGNTADSQARKALERIANNKPYDDLVVLPNNVKKVKEMLTSSGSTEELKSILGKGAKTQNFAQSLLLLDKFSGFGNYKNPIGTPSVMDSWAIYVRNGGALKDKYDRGAVSASQKSKVFAQSKKGYNYYNKLVKEYGEAAQILGVPVRELQARTWGWARTQMGSRSRNDSFASGYVPNFANVNAEKLILGGQGPNLLLTSPYDSLKASLDPSSQISGGIGYGLKFPDRSYASTAKSAGVDAMQALHDYARKQGGRAYYAPHVPTGAISKYGTASGGINKRNIFFLQQLVSKNKKDFPRSFVQTVLSINPANASLIQTGMLYDTAVRYLSKKGLSSIAIGKKFREGAAGLHDEMIEKYTGKNKYSISGIVSRISDVGGSAIAPSSYHALYPKSTYADAQFSSAEGIDIVNEFEKLTGVKAAGTTIQKYSSSGRPMNTPDPVGTRYQPLSSFLPFGVRFEKGDAISKMFGLAGGYIPNFIGLSNAVSREKTMTGLPASQIMAHFDGKGNPIAVTNKKDEPRGLNDVINKSKGYVPNFAPFRGPGGRFARRPTGNAEGGVGGIVEFFIAQAINSITNTLLSEGLIDEKTAIGIEVATGFAAAGSQLYKGLKASKGQSFGRQAASALPALLTGAAVAGTGYAGISNANSQRKQREIDKEADKSANEFKDLTEGTQELIDTISKLDAAFKDASSSPDQLLKLGKRESELINTLSVKNNDLAIRLRAEPSVERRVNLIEEARRSATQKKSVEDEVLFLKQLEKGTPEDLISSFQKLNVLGGDKLSKASQQDLAPENINELLKSANLEPLLKFFNRVEETTKTKLIPQFLEVVKAEQKSNEINKKASEDLGKIRAEEISLRNKIQNERLKRQAETEARTEGLGGVKEFVSKFGERSSISFESDIKKADAQKSAITAFTNRVSALNNLRLSDPDKQVIKGLLEIKEVNDKTFLTVKGLISGVSDPETKKKLEDLAGFAENQYKELQTQNAIAEIQKNAQLKVLSIQEKLSFGGGISTSINARSRIDSINAPLRGALEYRLGSMLGSERSQSAGLTNLFKSLKDQFPGLLESSKGLANVTKTLTNLKFKDLQRDLLRNADLLQSTGFGNEAQLLRQKALSPQGMLELRSMAESQANAELSSGQTPTEATNYLNENLLQVLKSLATKLGEEDAIKAKEKETEPQQQEVITKANEQRDKLYTDIKKTIEQAFGNQVNIQKSIITAPNSVINATTNSTPSYSGQNPPPIPLGMSKGFIPSFYNPLREAIDRESQYVPESSIRVNQSKKLVSSSNPFGLAVTNTIDEPNGLSSIGLASRGFIPNFADKEKEMLQPPGTAKIPVISKMVGRFFTNVTTPVNYDLGSKVKQLGETGLGGSLYSFITDTPSDQVTAGYKKGTYVADKGATEAREPVYRWMYGLEPQTDWQKFYVKNADNTVSFNRGTPEGKNLFNRAVLNAVKSKLEGDPTAHRHSVMSNYGYSIEGGKLKFFDRWDFDTHEGEQGLFDFFKPSSKPSGDLANPNSAYNQVNKDVASGSFTGRLKNTIRAGMSSVTEPVNITGEIPLSELPKLFKEADRTYKYKDNKTGKVISEYPFLKDPSLLKKITPNTNPQITANFAKGYIPNFAKNEEAQLTKTKVPILSKLLGRLLTNTVVPAGYDTKDKIETLKKAGMKNIITAFLEDKPITEVSKRTVAVDPMTKVNVEARNPLFRWMFGLNSQTDWKKYYIKNPDGSVSYNRATKQGMALFLEAANQAVTARMDFLKDGIEMPAGNHSVMGRFSYSFNNQKLKFSDLWDFGLHSGEQPFSFKQVASKIAKGGFNLKNITQILKESKSSQNLRQIVGFFTKPPLIKEEISIAELYKLSQSSMIKKSGGAYDSLEDLGKRARNTPKGLISKQQSFWQLLGLTKPTGREKGMAQMIEELTSSKSLAKILAGAEKGDFKLLTPKERARIISSYNMSSSDFAGVYESEKRKVYLDPNELSKGRKNAIRLASHEYGHKALDYKKGLRSMLTSLSDELDKVLTTDQKARLSKKFNSFGSYGGLIKHGYSPSEILEELIVENKFTKSLRKSILDNLRANSLPEEQLAKFEDLLSDKTAKSFENLFRKIETSSTKGLISKGFIKPSLMEKFGPRFSNLIKQTGKIKTGLSGAVGGLPAKIGAGLSGATGRLGSGISGLLGGAGRLGSGISSAVSGLPAKIGAGLSGATGGVGKGISDIGAGLYKKILASRFSPNLSSFGKGSVLSNFSDLLSGAKGLTSTAPSQVKNILSKIGNIQRPKGLRGLASVGGFALQAAGAAYTSVEAIKKAKEGDFVGAVSNAIAGGIFGASLFGKAGKLLPGALGVLEAYDIYKSKNFQVAEDVSDIFFGKKPEGGRGIGDYIGGAVGLGFDAMTATNPLGQAYLLGKYGYRVGNVIENKLGIGERLGEEYAGRDATISAGRASKSFFERAGMTNFNLTKPNLSLADVASGKVSPDDYINYRNAAINDMNIPKEEKERLKRETEKNLDRPLMRDPATGTYKFANAETRYPGEMASTVQTSSMRDVRSARERNAEIVDFQNQVAAEESVKATKERARQRAIENPLPTIMYNDFTGSPNRFYNVPSEENYVTTQRNERMPTPEEQSEMDSKNRSRIVRGIKENESLNELYSSRDKANYLIEQEKTYGTFRKEDFDDPSLYSTYLSRKKEKETADKREMAALKNPAVQELRNRSRTGFYDAEVQQAFARGTSVEQMRRENAGAAQQPSKIGGVQYSDEEIKEAFAKGISVEELRKSKNKSKGFIPNFSSAFLKERQDILNSPAYAGYRNAAPQMSKYYKNVVTNSAEIEVPARDVYNRMGFFGAEPKNPNQQYAILNPAQQAQLGYAANGFVPNFAGEQFANSMSEALQKIFAPMMDKIGSSITNSNVVNINDQRTFETTSDKIAGVMEFLQSQFPNQFARKMGPQNLA